MSTNYRQGQAPYGGDVRPGGDVLLLHEEFEAGKPAVGAPFGPIGTPAAQLQQRWLPWNHFTPELDLLRWIDPIAQRFSIYAPGPAPSEGPRLNRWAGNVLRMPPPSTYLVPEEDEPDELVGYLTVFAGVSAGPGQLLSNAFRSSKAINYAGLVVSASDLAAGNAEFVSLGVRQDSDPNGTIIIGQPYLWKGKAFMGTWDGASQGPTAENNIETGDLGLLLRLDMIMEQETEDDETVAITQIEGFFSNDGGRGWTSIGDTLLKGPGLINLPNTIGFGVSSTWDGGSDQIEPINCTGGFDFLRIYRRPFDELSQLLNPDGGRNWP